MTTALLIAGGAAVLAGVAGLAVRIGRRRGVAAVRLALTLLIAFGALVAVTTWLAIVGTPLNEALKTGGLAAGSVVAMYALWLNDRRRRVDEQRQELETRRTEHDRERTADDRFAKAVELLGNDADQVRVGAMHALAGLARSRPDYTQTVIDVLCAYLRRPFDHPGYTEPADPNRAPATVTEEWPAERIAEANRERQVRTTAQRLIVDLLIATQDTPRRYDLDLTEAVLEYLNLGGLKVGSIVARRARLLGLTKLAGLRAGGPVLFTGAVFEGRTWLDDARFDGGLALVAARLRLDTTLERSTVDGFVDIRMAAHGELATEGFRIADGIEVKLPHGWELAEDGTVVRP